MMSDGIKRAHEDAIDQAEKTKKKAKPKPKEEEKSFNYSVGHYWVKDSGAIGVYAYGNEVHYGTWSSANKFLKYVKSKASDRKWKIFQLVEVPRS
jgi:hypothetical protein